MTRWVADEEALRAFLRGVPLRVGQEVLQISPHVGWLAMAQAAIDAARSPPPPKIALVELKEWLPDPPEAEEFRDNRYRKNAYD